MGGGTEHGAVYVGITEEGIVSSTGVTTKAICPSCEARFDVMIGSLGSRLGIECRVCRTIFTPLADVVGKARCPHRHTTTTCDDCGEEVR